MDLIAAHVLPYWNRYRWKTPFPFVLERAKELKALFQKPLLLAEVGWQMARPYAWQCASRPPTAIYLRTLLNALNHQRLQLLCD